MSEAWCQFPPTFHQSERIVRTTDQKEGESKTSNNLYRVSFSLCVPQNTPGAPKCRQKAEITLEAVKIIRPDTYKLPQRFEAMCL